MTKKILLLGANGFIGSDLTAALLANSDYQLYGLDIATNRLGKSLDHPRFHFFQGDIAKSEKWLDQHIKKCDIILPLIAIATPATYVSDPLRVFELDFEVNLSIIKKIVFYKKRLIFPSSSEVYGMCQDDRFDEETSFLTVGPIHKERWIYACSKQMLDRVIYAYGQHQGLQFTLFRPFNWIGPKQDDPFNPNSRVLIQFIGNIMQGQAIKLVDGGHQRRTFTDISDGIDCLVKIIANHHNKANGRIFNIGNPQNDCSIAQLAQMVIKCAKNYPNYQKRAKNTKIITIGGTKHYGNSYQDIKARVPAIDLAKKYLNWQPTIPLITSVNNTLAYHLG